MALWQTGITWAPSCAMIQENPDGAAKHVVTELVIWIRKVTLALEAHKRLVLLSLVENSIAFYIHFLFSVHIFKPSNFSFFSNLKNSKVSNLQNLSFPAFCRVWPVLLAEMIHLRLDPFAEILRKRRDPFGMLPAHRWHLCVLGLTMLAQNFCNLHASVHS